MELLMNDKHILITGAAGYIGTHTVLQFLNAGFNVISLDNFSNSSEIALENVKLLSGRGFISINGDVADHQVTLQW